MPFRPRHSFLRVDSSSLSNAIHTDSVEDLFGMWSLFSKTSHAIDDGRRLENLSWRLWNRETFCCRKARDSLSSSDNASEAMNDDASIPPLSSSCDSASSTEDFGPPKSPPELKCCGNQCDKRHEKHITSDAMQKIIQSIEEKQELEPIDISLPSPPLTSTASSEPQNLPTLHLTTNVTTSQPSEPTHSTSLSASQATFLESSASTVDTQDEVASQTVGSDTSSNTEMSKHSIVRGFVPGGAPSSYRSQTNLAPAQPTPILKNSPNYPQAGQKKKGAMFQIGTSSGEDESSFDSQMNKRSLRTSGLSASLTRSSTSSRKQTSFKDEIAIGRVAHSPVFESDDEDEEVSESAIEDDDDSSDWEDSDDHSGPSSVNEHALFQRVDSRPDLTSRRSLLTTQLHEPDRARALANAASRSTPQIKRSNRNTPNGPSVATSPEPNSRIPMPPSEEDTRSKPIIMTTSNLHASALSLSPRTTRRNMLSTELTESLRKNLLWERQHRSTGNLAALRKRHQPQPPPQPQRELRQRPEPAPVLGRERPHLSNDYFNAGLQEYHAKGW